jgi:hypothetical protein
MNTFKKNISGQLFGLADSDDPVKLVAGQTEDGSVNFVPGQVADGVFHPGLMFWVITAA